MNIFIGNISYEVTEDELREEFEAFGKVESINLVTDKYSGRPKGFAFVEMKSSSEAEAAIAGLKGKSLKNRELDVSEARPKIDNRGGDSYSNRRSGGYGGGGHRGKKGGGFSGGRRRY